MSKRKKVVVGKKDTIDALQFMEMHGVECSFKRNIKLSRKIAVAKIRVREVFDSVKAPRRVDSRDVNREDILRGNVICLKDDFSSYSFYENPQYFSKHITTSKSEKAKLYSIRKKILAEQGLCYDAHGNVVEIEKKNEIINLDDYMDEDANMLVTENHNRLVKSLRAHY